MKETGDLPIVSREEIEKIVGSRVKDVGLYQMAFTHRSAQSKYNLDNSYETIEFMGDSILGFIITKYLYDRYAYKQEGFLTRARTRLVRGKTLSVIAKKMELDQFVLMDDKGIRNNWNKNPKILEDVFEALVGAIYLDLGMIYARTFVLTTFERFDMFSEEVINRDDNYKDHLMRKCQSHKFSLPLYEENAKNGHSYRFSIFVTVNGIVTGYGQGKTKKDAEQMGAKMALENWDLYFSNDASTGRDSSQ